MKGKNPLLTPGSQEFLKLSMIIKNSIPYYRPASIYFGSSEDLSLLQDTGMAGKLPKIDSSHSQ